ncbi:hypothetical protein [Bacillus toyonensis]|uniref:hypothetical protein n=1 Tax=Bacillus toyonensis TaxID=155322 RepID=UPI001CD22AFC|nr:hypothetical protein [Bacillus toyonensis]MCA1048128.1 hypothetical protein [Bacillus toyonensis]
MYYNPYPYDYRYNYQYPYGSPYPYQNTFRTDFSTKIGQFFTVPQTIPDVGAGIEIYAGTRVFIHKITSSGLVTIVAPIEGGGTCRAISANVSPEALDGIGSY